MPRISQNSFTSGELAPSLNGRTELEQYASGAALLKNFIIHPHGGASNRPGTRFICRVLGPGILVKFEYSVTQNYVLVFTDRKMRIIKDRGIVICPPEAATHIIRADTYKWTVSAKTENEWHLELLAGGDPGVSIPAEIWEYSDIQPVKMKTGSPGSLSAGSWAYGDNDTLGYSTVYVRLVTSGDPNSHADGYLKASNIVEVTTPYAVEHLRRLDYTQSADVMTITHPKYPVKELTRTDHHVWTLTDKTFVSSLSAPANLEKTFVGGMTGTDRDLIYYVTAATSKGEESAPCDPLTVPVVATWPGGGLVKLTWDAVAGADHYVVYKNSAGLPGYIGSASSNKFTDDNITPDASWGVPNVENPFDSEDNYPGAVGIYQQRLMLGRTNNAPLTVFGSRNGALNNFNTSTPLKDDDAVEYPLASMQVNEILYFVPLNELIVITTGGPWTITHGSSSDAITPTSVQADCEGNTPAHPVKPIVVGKSILLVETFGQVVRDMLYNFASNSFEGTNLSVLANHLFMDHTLIDWAYQRAPDSIVWCVRDDGILPGMTYLREHKVWGWHWHETKGEFESACSIKGTDYDEVYFIVKREIMGEEVRYIECLTKRFYAGNIEDAYFVDCGLTYNGDPATVISGFEHLEGESVSVLADGNVIPGLSVSGGIITLPHSASVVHVGLPYVSEFKSLPLDFSEQAGPMQGRKKKITSISVKFLNSRGGWMGTDPEDLQEMKFRENEGYNEPTALFTGDKAVSVNCNWDTDTSIYVKQTDPLPITILSLSAEVELGDD